VLPTPHKKAIPLYKIMSARAAKRQRGEDGKPIEKPAEVKAVEKAVEDVRVDDDSSDDDDDDEKKKVAPRNLIKNWAMVQNHPEFTKFKEEHADLIKFVEENVGTGPVWEGNGRNANKILRGVYYAVCYKDEFKLDDALTIFKDLQYREKRRLEKIEERKKIDARKAEREEKKAHEEELKKFRHELKEAKKKNFELENQRRIAEGKPPLQPPKPKPKKEKPEGASPSKRGRKRKEQVVDAGQPTVEEVSSTQMEVDKGL
jgi:hypothetical protein